MIDDLVLGRKGWSRSRLGNGYSKGKNKKERKKRMIFDFSRFTFCQCSVNQNELIKHFIKMKKNKTIGTICIT